MATIVQNAIDLVHCSKLRVIIAQMDEDVDEDKIENAVEAFASAVGARYSVHVVPVDAGTKYRETVAVALEPLVESPPSETSEDGNDEEGNDAGNESAP